MNNSVLERVRQLAADVLGVPLSTLKPETGPDTVEDWDSVQHLNLTLELEQQFGIHFEPEETINDMHNIAEIADLVEQKLGSSKKR